MSNSWPLLGFVTVGTLFFVYGALVVYSDSFFSYMNRSYWNPKGGKQYMIFGTNIYSYAYLRYARGMGTMILGIFIMILPIRHK